MAATAKRGEMRIISVVIGEETSDNRFADVRTMFDYAFANYSMHEVVTGNREIEEKTAEIVGGKVDEVSVCPIRSGYVFGKKSDKKNVTIEYEISSLKAPCKQGEKVGHVTIYENNIAVDTIDLVASVSVEKASFYDVFQKVAQKWNLK